MAHCLPEPSRTAKREMATRKKMAMTLTPRTPDTEAESITKNTIHVAPM
jgi:hypothetical protein